MHQNNAHLFVSYSTSDRERALAIADTLEGAGLPVWVDRRGISGGDLWAAEITAAIRTCRALLLICTASSVTSRNVRQEIQLAWEHDRPILPLILEPVRFPDELAYFVQGRQWIEVRQEDPSDWIAQVARFMPRLPSGEQDRRAEQTQPPAAEMNLPAPPTAIVGRDEQITDICGLLQQRDHQLVTLIGPGGVGKTRLALAVAWRMRETFPGAVQFVDLAPIRDPQLVLPAIARSLDLTDAGQESLLTRMRSALAGQPLLIVLDNVEQVLDAAGEIGELLAALPDLTLLATSREPLRLRAERIVEVEPLMRANGTHPVTLEETGRIPAVALFVTRAAAAKPGFALTRENAGAITDICWRLDGLPLAIELAAARISLLAPDAMLRRLEQRLPLLTAGARDLPQRQRTLRDAIAWSEDLLTDDERAVFRRLSVFAGGFTLESALAVTDTPGSLSSDLDVLAAMERLVAHSLLRQISSVGGETRFTMLATIREFGFGRLEERGEAEEAHQRHATLFCDMAERAAPELSGPGLEQALRRLQAENDNFRAALTWSVDNQPETALRLCAALHEFWLTTSALREGRLWCDRALTAGAAADRALVAEAMFAAARLAYLSYDYVSSRPLAERAIALFEELGDQRGIALAKNALANSIQEDPGMAHELLTEALSLIRPLGDAYGFSIISNNLAVTKMSVDDYEGALELLLESAAADRTRGDSISLFVKAGNIVESLVFLGRVDEALPILREVVREQRTIHHRAAIYYVLEAFALTLSARGHSANAVRLLGAADAERQLAGAPLASPDEDTVLKTIRELRERLTPEEYESAWQTGRALTYQEAMEEASAALDAWEAELNAQARNG